MSLHKFVIATTIGGAVMATAWTLIGKAVGHNWTKWKHALGYVDYFIVACLLLVLAYLAVRWWRNRGTPEAA